MKKKLMIFFIIFFSGASFLFAQEKTEIEKKTFTPKEKKQQMHLLSMGTYNDSINANWTANTDDYRSFGSFIHYENTYGIEADFKYFGLTDRPKIENNQVASRNDELILDLIYNFTFKINPYNKITVAPIVGTLFYGNILSQSMQNYVHTKMSIPLINYKYDNSFKATGIIGSKLFHTISFHLIKDFTLEARSGFKVLYRPGYSVGTEILCSAKLRNSAYDNIEIGVKNRFDNNYSISHTAQTVADKESGWTIFYKANIGFLHISREIHPDTGFSLGTAGANFVWGRQKKPFKKDSFSFEEGFSMGIDGTFTKIRFRGWENNQINFLIDFRSGNAKREGYPSVRYNLQQFIYGFDFAFLPLNPKFTITPFIATGIGLRRELLIFFAENYRTKVYQAPTLTIEGGVRMFARIPKISGNVLYGFAVADAFVIPFKSYTEIRGEQKIDHLKPCNDISFSILAVVDF